ncbi:hypothetical protein L1987_64595 [Smallanthus sonchifolius]|uniref:Uncharacterized protein n=1 Tax=Smallanthus sonchifolius TaxID=185202 RepID=A0ACB9BS20_9ASTR|nr:hypothetical protein L1987_64595 [Smallanthus sonchifolius]
MAKFPFFLGSRVLDVSLDVITQLNPLTNPSRCSIPNHSSLPPRQTPSSSSLLTTAPRNRRPLQSPRHLSQNILGKDPKVKSNHIMLEGKKTIGLSWEPQLPSLLFGTKTDKSQNVSESSLAYKPNSELVDGLFVPPNDPKKVNKLLKKQVKDTTGKGWFDMPAPTLTSELKKDLKLLKLRNVIDPKRHYKKGDSKMNSFPKYFQVGTVVEPVSEYFTSRLTKRERKPTLADELLSDQSLKDYRKRKVREIEEKNLPGGVDKWKIKGKSSWKRAKQRRH